MQFQVRLGLASNTNKYVEKYYRHWSLYPTMLPGELHNAGILWLKSETRCLQIKFQNLENEMYF